ncbi:hypothetical protein [Plantactinospora sonchi]|uniref:Uncharacterized protein n=1 Tax=Plantactinospora sonchi TaxID=1544735 RepID=A0ABU7S2Y1_9ACTN
MASAAPSSPAAAGGQSDKELCESVKKAGDKLKEAFIGAMTSGEEPEPAAFKGILTDMSEEVTALVAAAEADSKVAAALKAFGAETSKAASAADPVTAAANPAFEKAGADITAACKTAGVTVNF